ncbi:MAG: hypothetical protein K1X74_14610 [Pirellulales bacterium]|nr:hypothetical protein [Pirellulales bacterium]
MCLSALTSTAAASEYEFTPIALTRTDGPLGPNLGPGTEFLPELSFPTINNNGEIAFRASTRTAEDRVDNAIWKVAPGGEISLVASERAGGTIGPDIAGATFTGLGRPILSENGAVGFSGHYNGPGVNGTGLFIDTDMTAPQAVALLDTDGPLGPNLGPGVEFDLFPLNDHTDNITQFTADGVFTWVSPLQGAGVDSANRLGLFQASAAGVTPIARSGVVGALGPGLPSSAVFAGFPSGEWLAASGAGDVAFRALVTGGDVTFFTQNGAWQVKDYNAAQVVQQTGMTGPLGPGIPGTFNSMSPVLINDDGELSFIGQVNNTIRGAWKIEPGGSPQPMILSGTDGPLGPGLGAGVTISSFTLPFQGLRSNTGELYAITELAGAGVTGANDQAVLRVTDDGIDLVMREGNYPTISSLPSGVVIQNVLGSITLEHGVLLGVRLQGTGVTFDNNIASLLWMDGSLSVLIRKGDVLDVDPGPGLDLRQVSLFDTPNGPQSTGADGLPRFFNEHGKLVLSVTFTDGSSGLFTTVVPEPAGAFLASLALVGLLAIARRRSPAGFVRSAPGSALPESPLLSSKDRQLRT